MKKSLRWRWLAFCVVLIAIVPNVKAIELPGIGTINLPSFRYGKLKRDRDVNTQFQSYKVLPGYTYYTSGQAEVPLPLSAFRINTNCGRETGGRLI